MSMSWIKRLAAAAWLLSLAGAAHAGELVGPPELLWSGPSRALAAADLDQDGDEDLVLGASGALVLLRSLAVDGR